MKIDAAKSSAHTRAYSCSNKLSEILTTFSGRKRVAVLAPANAGRSPRFPAIGLFDDVGIFFAVQRGFGGFVLFESGQIFQEQQPRGLFGVIEFRGAKGGKIQS